MIARFFKKKTSQSPARKVVTAEKPTAKSSPKKILTAEGWRRMMMRARKSKKA